MGLAIAVGAAITMVVQSSSITTSTLTPLVGVGVLRLEEMFPLTIGANIGTTVTALLASLGSGKVDSLQVALAHLFFNITGILIFYPIPFMRRIPLNGARALGKATRLWRGFPIVYILTLFILLPLILLGISFLFQQSSLGTTVLGSMLVAFIVVGLVYAIYKWRYGGGSESCRVCFERRQANREMMQTLPEDMTYLKAKVSALSEHTGLPEDEEEDVEAGEDSKLIEKEKNLAESAPGGTSHMSDENDESDGEGEITA